MVSKQKNQWQSVPIKGVYLGLFDGPHATPKPSSEGPIFLGIKNITDDGRLNLSDVRHIAEDDYYKWTKRVEPQPGDIVFTYEATLNRYAIIPKGFRGCLGRRLALIRPNPNLVDTRFLFYYFFGDEWRATINRNILSGSTVERILLTSFPNFQISLPPIKIQREISSILSAYDDLIENSTRRIRILEEMAQSLYREWFINFRFPGHEKVKMVDSPLGKIPEGWVVEPVNDLFEISGGGTPSKKVEEYWHGGEINWFVPSDLTASKSMFANQSSTRITEAGLKKSSARLFPPFSVMMTSRATIGVVAINTTQACTNQGFITCIPNDDVPLYYLYFWLLENKETFNNLASGATFKG